MAQLAQIALPFTILFESAKPVLEIDRRVTQLLYGEAFEIEKADGAFIYGTCKTDGYKGWVHQDCLTDATWLPTHFVDSLWAPIFPEATFKNWAMVTLPFLSRIEVDAEKTEGDYAFVPSLRGYIHKNHIKPLVHIEKGKSDIVETAKRFLEVPYQYGGRSPSGVDCASLVQLALLRAGLSCPRDTDQQEDCETLGEYIDIGKDLENPKGLKRGDLLYLKGHVGIMLDDKTVLNATARTMLVQIEKLNDFIEAYKAQGLFIETVRRPNI